MQPLGHHGERPVQVSRWATAPEEQVWSGLHHHHQAPEGQCHCFIGGRREDQALHDGQVQRLHCEG